MTHLQIWLTHVINGAEQIGCFCQCGELNGRDFHRVLQPLWDTVQRWRTPHREALGVTHTQVAAICWARQARGAAWKLRRQKWRKLHRRQASTFLRRTNLHTPCLRTAQMRPAGNHFNRLPCTTHAHAFSPPASSVLDRVNVPIKWSTLEYSCGWSAEGGFAPTRWNPFSLYKWPDNVTFQQGFWNTAQMGCKQRFLF